MSERIDLNRPTADIALLLINQNNGTNIDYSLVGLTDATPISDGLSGKNTAVTVYPLPNSIYYGNVQLEYDRVSLQDLVGTDVRLVSGHVFTLTEIVETLNRCFGLGLAESEVTIVEHLDDGTAVFKLNDNLVFKPNELIKVRNEFDHSTDRAAVLANVMLPSFMPVG